MFTIAIHVHDSALTRAVNGNPEVLPFEITCIFIPKYRVITTYDILEQICFLSQNLVSQKI